MCPQPRPATTHASGGLRKAGGGSLAFEGGAIFSVPLSTAIHRVGVASRPCKTIGRTAKKRIHLLISSAKKRYTALMYARRMYGALVRWLTVFLSEKKRKEYS